VAAPVIILGNIQDTTYLGLQIGSVVVQPTYGIDFAAISKP
jgi:hypothetical protein